MAVLVEGLSVIVRRDAITARYPGGWPAFLDTAPNDTLCFDDDLACVGFMTPVDVGEYVGQLQSGGLTFLRDRAAVDMAVVDQMEGPTAQIHWLEFTHVTLASTDNKVAACWLYEGPRDVGRGVYMSSTTFTIATPAGSSRSWPLHG